MQTMTLQQNYIDPRANMPPQHRHSESEYLASRSSLAGSEKPPQQSAYQKAFLMIDDKDRKIAERDQ